MLFKFVFVFVVDTLTATDLLNAMQGLPVGGVGRLIDGRVSPTSSVRAVSDVSTALRVIQVKEET